MTEKPSDPDTNSLVLTFGHEELVVRQRYEVVSIINDILVAVWFAVGSIFFFFASLTFAGTVLFLVGSLQLLVRPVIRLRRKVHLQRLHPEAPTEASHDF